MIAGCPIAGRRLVAAGSQLASNPVPPLPELLPRGTAAAAEIQLQAFH